MFAKAVVLTFVLAGVTAKEDMGLKYLMRVYEDCSKAEGVMPCLKKKAILFFDRAARIDTIPLLDGVDVVKTSNSEVNPMSENEIEESLPRSLTEKDAVLTDMLWDRVASFTSSRTIQLSLPKMSGEELGRGIEEGRGKMKKMMGMMMMGAAMKMVAMTPIAMGGLFMLAGKALIVAKIALLLSAIMILKKLMGMKGGGGGGGGGGGHDSHSHGGGGGYGGGSSGWSSGGSSGGWERRSIEPSDLAYAAYNKKD